MQESPDHPSAPIFTKRRECVDHSFDSCYLLSARGLYGLFYSVLLSRLHSACDIPCQIATPTAHKHLDKRRSNCYICDILRKQDDSMEQTRLTASIGLALQIGCFMTILAIAALGLGLGIDAALHSRPVATLLCIFASIPINLFLAVRMTQYFAAKIIPPDKVKSGDDPSKKRNTLFDDEQ